MSNQCDGKQLILMLRTALGCNNKNQLATKLGVSAASIQSWERAENLSKTVVMNVIKAVRDAAIKSSIEPIMEFHQLNHGHGHEKDTLLKKIDHELYCNKLRELKGIYSFYDSNGRIIYVGKTEKKNLLSEMNQAFNLVRPNYVRKLLDNKSGKFIARRLAIKDTAEFVSAYAVNEHAIGNVEALLIRMVPNDVVNKRTEKFRLS
jgi:transcriptional regulator with XRE-family HTH domain